MLYALQVYVRGFQDRSVGNDIIEKLKDIGFSIRDCVDGNDDSRGGIIESNVSLLGELTTGEPLEIYEAVNMSPGVFLQYRIYSGTDVFEIPPKAIGSNAQAAGTVEGGK